MLSYLQCTIGQRRAGPSRSTTHWTMNNDFITCHQYIKSIVNHTSASNLFMHAVSRGFLATSQDAFSNGVMKVIGDTDTRACRSSMRIRFTRPTLGRAIALRNYFSAPIAFRFGGAGLTLSEEQQENKTHQASQMMDALSTTIIRCSPFDLTTIVDSCGFLV